MALFGFENAIDCAGNALAASSEADGYPVENLRVPLGSSATAWQTSPGVKAASVTVTSAADVAWRAVCLSRTNLTPSATIRVRVLLLTGVVGALPSYIETPTAPGWVPAGSFSRTHTPAGSFATTIGPTGAFQEAGPNAARVTHNAATGANLGALSEGERPNGVRNPRFEFAVAPNFPQVALPLHFTGLVGAGLTRNVVDSGIVNGKHILRIRWFGTTTGAVVSDTIFDSGIAITAGQDNAGSFECAMVGGSLANVTSIVVRMPLTGASPANQGPNIKDLLTGQLQPFSLVASATSGTGAIVCRNSIGIGAVDFTLEFAIPQFEPGASFPSSAILPAVGSPAASTRGADILTRPLAAAGVGFDGALTAFWTGTMPHLPSATSKHGIFSFDDGTTANVYYMRVNAGTGALVVGRGLAGVYAEATVATYIAGVEISVAMRIDGLGNVSASLNGGALVNVSGGPIAGLTTGRFCNTVFGDPLFGRYTRTGIIPLAVDDAQFRAISTLGSLSTLSPPLYDSGIISAGVAVGIGQALHVLPGAVSAVALRVDIADPSNPDGFLNIPLAYAGPGVDAPLSPNSRRDPQVRDSNTTTRGGTVLTQPLSRARAWQVEATMVLDADSAWLDALDAEAGAQRNILFVPRTPHPREAAESIFGLMRSGSRGFLTATGRHLVFSASISERL